MSKAPWLATALVPTCLAYIAYFGAAGVSQPYFPIWLESRGLGEAQIATLLSIPMLFRIVFGPMIGWVADRLGRQEHILRLLLTVTLFAALCCALPVGNAAMLPIFALMVITWQGMMPLLEVRALDLVRKNAVTDYGRVRLWGSVSFIAMSVGGGYILHYHGPASILVSFMAANAALLLVSFLPHHAAPRSTEPRNADRYGRPTSIAFWGFLVAAAIIQASHMPFNAFGSIYLRQNGYPDTTIGTLWGIAAVSEIAMFWMGPYIARWLQPQSMLAVAALCAAARWGLFALGLDISYLVLLQMMQALSFSMTYLGLMRIIGSFVGPDRSSSVQGLYVTIQAVCSAGATMAAGVIFKTHGSGVFVLSAGLALIAFTLLVVFSRYHLHRSKTVEAGDPQNEPSS